MQQYVARQNLCKHLPRQVSGWAASALQYLPTNQVSAPVGQRPTHTNEWQCCTCRVDGVIINRTATQLLTLKELSNSLEAWCSITAVSWLTTPWGGCAERWLLLLVLAAWAAVDGQCLAATEGVDTTPSVALCQPSSMQRSLSVLHICVLQGWQSLLLLCVRSCVYGP